MFTLVGLAMCLSGLRFLAVVIKMSRFTLWLHTVFFLHPVLGAEAEGQLYNVNPPMDAHDPFFPQYIL